MTSALIGWRQDFLAPFEKFCRIVQTIPFSETEWEDAAGRLDHPDPIERAVAFFVRCRQSLAGRMDADAQTIYVGKAKSLRNRVRTYFHLSADLDIRKDQMMDAIDDVEFIMTDTEGEALALHVGEPHARARSSVRRGHLGEVRRLEEFVEARPADDSDLR